MSTANSRKPLSNASSTRDPNENIPRRPSVPSATGQGLARSPSVRQTRPLRKPTVRMSNSSPAGDAETGDEEAKSANAQLIADLKEQVDRAEQASEQYRRQLEVMQQRLDEVAAEQTTAEERDYQRQTDLDRLKAQIKDSERQYRELEVTYNEDKDTFLQERDRQARREAELQAVISRLNETLRTRSADKLTASRLGAKHPDSDNQEFEAPAPGDDAGTVNGHNPSQDLSRIVEEKDGAIEALRFDLAEAQLRLAEQEHMGDGRLQAMEKAIMEIKMQNARLVEENESFQMLLTEKTLKGDFLHGQHAQEDISGLSSLAEELESSGEATEGQTDAYRKLEAEYKALHEEKNALNLYIDKIIGRMLIKPGFEHIFTDQDEAPAPAPAPAPPAKPPTVEKALPAVPDQQTSDLAAAVPPVGVTGFLQRARSVVARPGGGKARPMSYAQPSGHTPPPPSANENPDTAPRIPINRERGHRRARSDQAQTDMAAAAVVNQMNRLRPLSPQLGQRRGSGYFPPRTPSADKRGGSSANSVTSEHSDEQWSNTDGSSVAAVTAATPQNQQNIPGAVMKQNQLRPLRLVQKQDEEEEMMKKANRGSWMGWLRGSTIEAQNE
ncbi:hypothetical protein LTR10_013125 [Elasticomyces elasticus]|uniref:M protein, serotype 2.1 n=1 Tax=Exophiala sideris TaxID=1016849 RepID=A0ABR0JB53_9EURO|nr:hypothetical protein LTR10_013125 [Elasticomyces elasticus]KAK5030500.1 hypothetical protein LTS07_005284 [Exophiala sideris]KAK5038554.1 hypothetical protein LTR13_004301 [Exophiala sideris]KAK5060435.1 hypothetical protein LTR69_005752 [Exophiala sideris]KAK5183347.1 hypothetical protein LTR44_004348 [Eurotiomycetes sp. CCFEE 6388]